MSKVKAAVAFYNATQSTRPTDVTLSSDEWVVITYLSSMRVGHNTRGEIIDCPTPKALRIGTYTHQGSMSLHLYNGRDSLDEHDKGDFKQEAQDRPVFDVALIHNDQIDLITLGEDGEYATETIQLAENMVRYKGKFYADASFDHQTPPL